MTQKELAAEWGVVHSFVSCIERGERPMPAWVAAAIRRGAKERSDKLTEFGEAMARVFRLFHPHVRMRAHCAQRAEQIAKMREEGLRVRDIAATLGTSSQTIYNYLHGKRGQGNGCIS